jgi:Domain of unknown function (DUF4411)
VRGYWNWLETKLKNGSVVTHKMVFDEIIRGALGEKPDPIAVWTKSRKGHWCSFGCTDDSKELVGKISLYCMKRYPFATANAFLGGADPFLIARAAVDGGIVVTQESDRKEPRIPKICREFNVDYVPLTRMNNDLKMSF